MALLFTCFNATVFSMSENCSQVILDVSKVASIPPLHHHSMPSENQRHCHKGTCDARERHARRWNDSAVALFPVPSCAASIHVKADVSPRILRMRAKGVEGDLFKTE